MMKIVAVILLVLLSVPSEAIEVLGPKDHKRAVVREVCVNGLAYVVVISGEGDFASRGVAITQVFVKSVATASSRPNRPKKCKNGE